MKIPTVTKRLSYSEKQTKEIAVDVANSLRGGEVLALYGDLGAGKTTFVKGMAEALGIKETITSPTFVLMRVFDTRKNGKRNKKNGIRTLAHIDAYRLKDGSELADIGALDYLGRKDVVTVIEWPERATELLKKFKKIIEITFEHGDESGERIIEIK